MKILILEDNPIYVSLLKVSLSKIDIPFTITGVAYTVKEALELINADKPDVLILDIELKGETSFDLFNIVSFADFQIIFVTGFDSFAIAAFDLQAVGYLVKPVVTDQLRRFLQIAAQNVATASLHIPPDKPAGEEARHSVAGSTISIPSGAGFDVIRINTIIRCEAVNATTHIFLDSRKKMVSSYNIGKFFDILSGKGFYSTHRSHIINLAYVKRYLRSGIVVMEDGQEIPLAKDKRPEFIAIFTSKGKSQPTQNS